jgi:RNA recognition motif-containing protein
MLAGAGLKRNRHIEKQRAIEYAASFFDARASVSPTSFFQENVFMSKNIYVGNLSWSTTEEEVRALFEAYGQVTSVKLVEDRETGRPRGFGFVEMDSAGALEAIKNLDGKEFGGRNLKVNEAKPRVERSRW